jgi:hypothetical protein
METQLLFYSSVLAFDYPSINELAVSAHSSSLQNPIKNIIQRPT